VGSSPYAVLGLRGIRWPAVGEWREWDELIGAAILGREETSERGEM
jgi:hypothetical protein